MSAARSSKETTRHHLNMCSIHKGRVWIARIARPLTDTPTSYQKSIRQLVTCNLKERDADLWLLRALQRDNAS